MISFDCVVRILLGDVAGRGQQLIEHARIRSSPIGAHLGRSWTVVECLGEESANGCEIPFLRNEDVDDLAELVDRPVQIDPPPGHFDVRLIDKPPITRGMTAGSCRVDQQRSEPLHPPEHAHVIGLDAPLGQQLLHVTVGL